MPPNKTDPIDPRYRSYIEGFYSPIPRDDQEKIIDSMLDMIESGSDLKHPLRTVLEQIARTIFRYFDFGEIAIGLKDRKTDTYRYELLFGYRKEIEERFKKLVYSHEDMVSYDRFPNVKTGRLSELNPVEGLPEEEKDLYNRPYHLGEERKSPDIFHEGDYVDIWMLGSNKEIVGWLELSGPRSGKLPGRSTIRWIELLAAISGAVIAQRWSKEDAPKK